MCVHVCVFNDLCNNTELAFYCRVATSHMLLVSNFPEVALGIITYFNTNNWKNDIMTFPCNKHYSLARG